MTNLETEEKILKELKDNFSGDILKADIQRESRIWIEVKREKAALIMDYMSEKMDFNHLSTISGKDWGDGNLGAIYHIANPSKLINVIVKTPLSDAWLDTLTNTFIVAENFERELADMFGIKIRGLKEGRRYPLPEDWPEKQYPLRKTWNQNEFFKSEGGACYYEKHLKDKKETEQSEATK